MNNVPTISASIANQQGTQPSFFHIEDDVPSTTHINEPSLIKDNNAKSIKNIIELGKAEVAPSCMDAYSLDPKPSFISLQSSGQNIDNPDPPQIVNLCHENEEETLQQVLDRVYETKIIELKNELKQCQVNADLKEEENKTFREELLSWINRWKEVNIKKNQYKKAKKSMICTNQHLLEQVEKQKLVIIKLKPNLAEARKVVDLQNRT